MAGLDIGLKVNKQDFVDRINLIEQRMSALQDVVSRYRDAKANLDQFLESDDSNYQAMIERIDANITAAGQAYAALQEAKNTLQTTVDQMDDMGNQVMQTVTAATEATVSTVNAAIKIQSVL